ncbi:MAG: hypothetical protein ACRDKV_00355 [Solirubrobacterales bacterium]
MRSNRSYAVQTELKEIRPGLYRWTAAHPEWSPGAAAGSPADWPQEVGCVLVEGPEATVLIDPLLPADRDSFLDMLDERVQGRGLPVSVLTTIGFHRRDRDQLVRRYEASTSRAKRNLPAGVESLPVRHAGETMFWLAEHRTLVSGDRIIGAPGGGLQLCPESWLGYLPHRMTAAGLRRALRPLLELPVERVLVSHGEPVLSDGRSAIAAALG